MNKKFKAIIAGVMATATVATMAISASARTLWAGDKTSLQPTNLSMSKNVGDTTNKVAIANGKIDELSWLFLYNERETKNGRVDLKLNYNADASAYKNDIIAVLYEGCTPEDAYIWTDGMVITDLYGRRVVAEVRYDMPTNRYCLVNIGTFEGTYGNNMGNLLSSLISQGNCSITLHLRCGIQQGKVLPHDIKGTTSLTSNIKLYKTDKYETSIYFTHRIAGMFVNSSLHKDGKTVFAMRNTPRNAMGGYQNQLTVFYSNGIIQMENNKDYKQQHIIGFNFGTAAMNYKINLNVEESSNRKYYLGRP